jgi:hypothetical protein
MIKKEGLAMVVKEGIPSRLDISPHKICGFCGDLLGNYFFYQGDEILDKKLALTVQEECYNIGGKP